MAAKKAEEGKSVIANLQEVLKASERVKDLVQQILIFSRQGETGEKPILLQTVVAEAFKLLRASFPTTLSLRTALSPTAGPVLANPTQIHQVVMNLATNAEFAMRGTAGRLDVTLEEVLIDDTMPDRPPGLQDGQHFRLTMTDSGHGIPPPACRREFSTRFSPQRSWEKVRGWDYRLLTELWRIMEESLRFRVSQNKAQRSYSIFHERQNPSWLRLSANPLRPVDEALCCLLMTNYPLLRWDKLC
jgi:signal transduction histidine kinase